MEKESVRTAKVFLVDAIGGLLLLQRNILSKSRPGRWDLPGGELAAGELPIDAAIRETFEETGIHLSNNHLLPFPNNPFKNESRSHDHNNERWFFLSKLLVAQPTVKLSTEHESKEWASLYQASQKLGHPIQRQVLKNAMSIGMFRESFVLEQY